MLKSLYQTTECKSMFDMLESFFHDEKALFELKQLFHFSNLSMQNKESSAILQDFPNMNLVTELWTSQTNYKHLQWKQKSAIYFNLLQEMNAHLAVLLSDVQQTLVESKTEVVSWSQSFSLPQDPFQEAPSSLFLVQQQNPAKIDLEKLVELKQKVTLWYKAYVHVSRLVM